MRRKALAQSVRSVVEFLEGRLLLSNSYTAAAGTAAITGVVYNDLNGNGVQDIGEPVVPGATVSLTNITNILNVTVENLPTPTASVTADANGNFAFTELAPGQYDITITPLTGYLQDAPKVFTVSLEADVTSNIVIGETNTVAAGGTGTANLTGTLFNDATQSGTYQPVIDDFLAGDTVYLDLNGSGTFNVNDPTSITNNTGQYNFNLIAPGSYLVEVVPRPGFHQDPPGYVQATVYSDQTVNTNIGENNRATISGVVFEDLNGNGKQDPGELGVPGETVFIDTNNDGILEAGIQNPSTGFWDVNPETGGQEPFATADATGHYSLSGLTPGTYRIFIDSTAGLYADSPGWQEVTLTQGENFALNLGEGVGSNISGTVYDDRNANGTRDVNEVGLPNQVVYLDTSENGIYDQAAVDSNGFAYLGPTTTFTISDNLLVTIDGLPDSFLDLAAGDFVNITLQQGGTTVAQQIQASDVAPTGQSDPASGVGPSGVITSIDLVNFTVTVQAAEPWAVTDPNGNFSFNNLGPGNYTMRMMVPDGAVPTGPVNASHDYTYTLGSATTVANQDLGIQTPDLTTTIVSFPTKPTLTNVEKHALVRVTNVGSLRAKGLAGVDLWAQTTNGTVDTTSAFLIANFKGRSINLNPGQSRIFNVEFEYPTQLPQNIYYVSAHVVSSVHDNDSDNDWSLPVGPVKVGPPYVDYALTYASQPALIVDPGQSTGLALVLTNDGNVTSSGAVTFRIYLDLQPTIEPTDVVQQSITVSNMRIQPGKSKIIKLGLIYPLSLLGSQYINVVAVSGDPLGETNLLNNTAVEAIPTRFD